MKKLLGYLSLGAIVVAGSLFGYKIATDNEFRGRLTRGAQDMYKESKKKVDSVKDSANDQKSKGKSGLGFQPMGYDWLLRCLTIYKLVY